MYLDLLEQARVEPAQPLNLGVNFGFSGKAHVFEQRFGGAEPVQVVGSRRAPALAVTDPGDQPLLELRPAEQSARAHVDDDREGTRLPRLDEHGSIHITRDGEVLGERAQGVGCDDSIGQAAGSR